MTVVDHEPHWWFLLKDGDTLLFDVNCSHGAVSYSWLMALNTGEAAQLESSGRAFLNRLAEDVQCSAPGIRGSTSVFLGRSISQARDEAVSAAVKVWRAGDGKSNGKSSESVV